MNKDIENITCGILFVYNNSILLVHSSGKKFASSYSIPKGHIHEGEKKKDCALREVYEETGIKISKDRLGKKQKVTTVNNKILYYYTVVIKDLNEIGLKDTVIKKKKLQLEEIDWAGFVPIKKATVIIQPAQIRIITDYINMNESYQYIIKYDNYK